MRPPCSINYPGHHAGAHATRVNHNGVHATRETHATRDRQGAGFCLVSVLPYPGGGGVGGWVGGSGRISGWVGVQPPPPPPGWGGTLWGPLGLSSQCHFFLSSVAGSV